MTDRFKFRAYVEDFCFDDEDGNEYKKSLMFYGVTVYDCATVGISDDELEKQLKTQGFTDNEIEQFESCCSEYDGWFTLDVDFVEQCTGLKDKNGKLIYEGDVVEFYSMSFLDALSGRQLKRKVGRVVWNNEYLKVDVIVGNETIPDLCVKTDDGHFVIIGNIHENPERLEGVK